MNYILATSKLVKLLLDNVSEVAYNKHIDSDIAQSITHTESYPKWHPLKSVKNWAK